jgi:cyanophycinase
MNKIQNYLILCLLMFQVTVGLSQQTGVEKTVGPEKGSLLIVGGGKVGPEIWGKFIELAGGASANIVVIPTAGDDSSINKGVSREKELLHQFGVRSVTVLHTRDAKEANTGKFVAPLKKATGIWFVGGRQWKLADAYLNTLAHREFNALLNRGGVVAGTSAGATIQGSFLLRGDTKGNEILVGDHLEGLDFIHNVAIDQHILKRNRQFDLIEVIKARPELLGIGIDESTAILVQKNAFEVLGDSYVAVYDINQINGNGKTEVGNYSTGGPFIFLSHGMQYDLGLRKVIKKSTNAVAASNN